eukprot:25741-Pelagomonas_calceolata.AAC.4
MLSEVRYAPVDEQLGLTGKGGHQVLQKLQKSIRISLPSQVETILQTSHSNYPYSNATSNAYPNVRCKH